MAIIIGILALTMLVMGLALFAGSFFWPSVTKNTLVLTERGTVELDKNGNKQWVTDTRVMPGRYAALVGGLILFIAGFGASGLRIIDPGTVGVAISAGQVDMNEKAPGINWVLPFVNDIKTFPTRVIAYHFDKLGAASKEYQDVFLTGTVNYHINPIGAAELFISVGDDFESKLVVPFFNDIIKEIVPQFGVAEVLPQRGQMRSLTVTKLQTKLTPYGLVVDDVALAGIDFNAAYNEAIQNKQIQELQIQTERNILAQKNVQAQQAQAVAKGQADAAIEAARGVAQSLLLTRQAEAQGNTAVALSLTQPILTQMAIDKFNPNVKIVLMPPGGSSFLFPSQLINPDPSPEASPAP